MTYTLTDATVGGPITAGGYNQLTTLLRTAPLVRVGKSAAQNTSPTAGTSTAVVWDLETYDPPGMHSNTVNNTQLIVPAGWSGYYAATANLRFNTSSAAVLADFSVNGVPLPDTQQWVVGVAGAGASISLSTHLFLNAGDYIEVLIQANAASVVLFTGNTSFSLAWLHV